MLRRLRISWVCEHRVPRPLGRWNEPRRAGIALLVAIAAAGAAIALGTTALRAQQVNTAITYSGTVISSIGQPVPAGTPISVFNVSTNAACGQGVVSAGGFYTVTVVPSITCTQIGTPLSFNVGGQVAQPTTVVSTAATVPLNLTVSGLPGTVTTSPLTYTGTVIAAGGLPATSGTAVIATAASTGTQCGQGFVGAGGTYTVAITPAPPCNIAGTILTFSVGGTVASPTATVTGAGGAQPLSLTLTGAAGTTGGSLIYTGTVTGGIQTAVAGTAVSVLAAGTGTSCGQGVVNSSGVYTVGILASPPCNTPGTTLIFSVNGVQASPTATVTAAGGTMTLNLFLSGTATGAGQGPQTQQLNVGCNLIVVAFGTGAVPQQVVTATANQAAVVSIWRWDNTRQRFFGFFPTESAASDLTTLLPRDAVFVCVNAATTITAP